MQLTWVKCKEGEWCPLETVDLTDDHFDGLEGVYIIWHAGEHPATVYVGQGEIAARLAAHREDRAIIQYAPFDLYATWARVGAQSRDGIERYLADTLQPKEGTHHPDADPIEVNLPWDD